MPIISVAAIALAALADPPAAAAAPATTTPAAAAATTPGTTPATPAAAAAAKEPAGQDEGDSYVPFQSTPNPILGLYRDRFQLMPFMYGALDASGSFGSAVPRFQRADGSGIGWGMNVQRVIFGFRGSVLDKLYYQFFLNLGGTNSFGPGQSPLFLGAIDDAYIAYKFNDAFALRIGQFNVPLTLENGRPPPFWDMLEGSRTAFLAIPGIAKDIGVMAHGFPGRFVYAVGLFNGEGNRRGPIDSQGDLMGRGAVKFNEAGAVRAQVGVSGRWGRVDSKRNYADAPFFPFTTERGYAFWTPEYLVPGAAGPTPVRILSSGPQRVAGADLIFEAGRFDIQAEGIYVSYGRREVGPDPAAQETLRAGELSGFSYYATANYWITEPPPVLKVLRWDPLSQRYPRDYPAMKFTPTFQIMARYEQMFLKYDSIANSPLGTDRGLMDKDTTRIRMDSLHVQLACSFGFRVKAALQWSMYAFPADRVDDRRLTNQALAPGAVVRGERGTAAAPNIPPGVEYGDPTYYKPYDIQARIHQEIGARVYVLFP